ncbi:succinyl-CoA:3-ketoacid-coenzyme A transferase [Cladophialophora yegresii CBS 114405]|uniref:Succinyl-CoA:3-ketoacid-coenzyme A transferase n=1 Tax=Cladophialophora yegresii CBS 114405 TaxID=1182544 RepID=W9VSC5_9EURO|nr:succinyl-CoA:3-ketoacid-coenzyme A transferase [Cladophialophora yegresii CBS 114405]EXJ58453.1 succinyl-CoA:3-ketoacid-coenzyme A transferase [Cladophialophora yegresii CBS 114405]
MSFLLDASPCLRGATFWGTLRQGAATAAYTRRRVGEWGTFLISTRAKQRHGQQQKQKQPFSVFSRKYRERVDAGIEVPEQGASKVYKSADDAIADLKDGSVILSAGFGLSGVAETLIDAIRHKGTRNLTVVSNNAGAGEHGLAKLSPTGQVSRWIVSFIGNNKPLGKQYHEGKVAVELCPQGTIAERLRAAGAGIPGFFTATGARTLIETGGIPHRLGPRDAATGKHAVAEAGRPRETRIFDGRTYLLETALRGDVAIVRAWKVDTAGNCIFRSTTKTYGVLMPKAAKLAIVEAEHVVPVGSLHPDHIDLPGIYIDRICPATSAKHIEKIVLAKDHDSTTTADGADAEASKRTRIARRAARELKDGSYVNLGVGIPTLAPSFLPPTTKVWLQSENGIVGMGAYPRTRDEADPDTINAGKEAVTLVPGASTFDSAESFGMIRGGHVDVSLLGALQVSASGDLANYIIPGKAFNGMGGAMDLVSNPDKTKIIVCTYHSDRDGRSKVVEECELPLTGKGVVSLIITELAVFEVDRVGGRGLVLKEVAEGVSVEEVRERTSARFTVAEEVGTF